MSLTKYRAFLKIAVTGNFSEAAQQLHCTQSAASRMIHDLETLWGVKLFSRYKSGAVLTPEGKELLSLVEKVVLADDDIKASITSFTQLLSGTVRIGSFASIASVWLPRVIKTFKKLYPNIQYEVLMGDFEEIEHWVRTGRVDFGFTNLHSSEGLDSILIAKDELFLAVYSSHPFAKLDSVPAKLLENEPFFLLEKGKTGSIAEYLQKQKVNPSIDLTTFEDYIVVNMVKMELGIGIVPNLSLQHQTEGVEIKELSPRGFRDLRLIVREEGKLSFVAQKFLQTFSNELHDLIDSEFSEKLKPYLMHHSLSTSK